MAVTARDAQRRLLALLQQVGDDQEAVEIIWRRGSAYLVSADQYRSVKETVYLLSSPRNAERLRRSIEASRLGEATEREVLEP